MTAALPVLLAVSFERGRGSGHLVRSAALTRGLRIAGCDASLAIIGDRTREEARLVVADIDSLLIDNAEIAARRWAFIISDRFKTPEKEFFMLRALAPVIGIDEGGVKRQDFDFLIDTLPQLSSFGAANLCKPALLELPAARKPVLFPQIPRDNAKILVVFGAEGGGGLVFDTAQAIPPSLHAEITLVTGALGDQTTKKAVQPDKNQWIILKNIDQLREKLASYDLVITHFGLCAFESLYAGTPVLLVSPTAYHQQLAHNAGFFSAGQGAPSLRHLPAILEQNSEAVRAASQAVAQKYKLIEAQHETFAVYAAALNVFAPRHCPLCRAERAAPIARFAEKTYRQCPHCKTIFMSRWTAPSQQYDDSYFFKDYERQYGKTYLEDFPHLEDMARKRLFHIIKIARRKTKTKTLLDIGCAYGAFLAAAQKAGFEVTGMDPSDGALQFVRDKFGIKTYSGFFPGTLPAPPPGKSYFDVISLWYVIEHFTEPEQALQKISRLLAPGGILAFSTPSSCGVSGVFSRRHFLQHSPDDHWTIWNPRTVRRVLKKYGFSVKKMVVSGHHPERFPVPAKIWRCQIFYRLGILISKLAGLGDTFEVYAVKTGK